MLQLPAEAGEFLANYGHDAGIRWSTEDLHAHSDFVNGALVDCSWLDWSTERAALDVVQAAMHATPIPRPDRCEAILLAGPLVELVDADWLFAAATGILRDGGRVIGIIPCLRDNSPESSAFAEFLTSTFRRYSTAEELLEMLHEAGLREDPAMTGFAPIPAFIRAAHKAQLGFQGFRRALALLEAQGYAAEEVGWGELRFVARLEEPARSGF